jgi:hypothetical protein
MSTLRPALKNSTRLPATIDEDRALDRNAWRAMVAKARLLTGEAYEKCVIELVATILIPAMRHWFEREFDRDFLETSLQQGLREGDLSLTRDAITEALAGDAICDAALRHVYVEFSRKKLLGHPGSPPAYMLIQEYGEHAILHDRHKRPPGHLWHDDFVQNVQTANLIYFVHREFDMKAERGQGRYHKGKRAPSTVSIVVAALADHGIGIQRTEASVQRNVWRGVPGKLIRRIAPALYQCP